MENASKAIIMAGGVLIAVAIISLALYAYSNFSGYAKSSEQILSANQIASFNRYYESVGTRDASQSNKYLVRGVDLLNVYNKAKNDESITVYSDVIPKADAISSDSSKLREGIYTLYYAYDSKGKIHGISTEYLEPNETPPTTSSTGSGTGTTAGSMPGSIGTTPGGTSDSTPTNPEDRPGYYERPIGGGTGLIFPDDNGETGDGEFIKIVPSAGDEITPINPGNPKETM